MFKFDLHPGESLVRIYRRSEWVLAKTVLLVFAAIYLPWTFLIKYDLLVQARRILLLWTFLVLLYALNKYLLWLINSYILTNRRLVVVQYRSLVHKIVSETPLEKILNISYETPGVFAIFLNFGNIKIQLAGTPEPLLLKHLSHPEKTKTAIWDCHRSVSRQTLKTV